MRSHIIPGLAGAMALTATLGVVSAREHKPQFAQVTVQTGRGECRVEMDAQLVGATDAKGNLLIADVEPGDHYLHVQCPGVGEAVYFLSPHADETVEIQLSQKHTAAAATGDDPSRVAANQIELRRLLQEAMQFRVRGRLDEAVAGFRQALQLDPENSDLHRELGITFLLGKEWKRARVEMIEVIRHDQTDADAHNGLGYALEKLGNLDGAAAEYRTAARLDPDDPTYRTHYLDALVKIAERQEKKK
jgi:hypothetical protein